MNRDDNLPGQAREQWNTTTSTTINWGTNDWSADETVTGNWATNAWTGNNEAANGWDSSNTTLHDWSTSETITSDAIRNGTSDSTDWGTNSWEKTDQRGKEGAKDDWGALPDKPNFEDEWVTVPDAQSPSDDDWGAAPVKQSIPAHGVQKGDAQTYVGATDDTFESFLLGPGEKKVEEKIDTRMPNTSIFHFNKEDHTLGNLLRAKLLTNSHVQFSAYRVPHPLFPTFELRVQTDGEVSPKEALLASCRDLITELSSLDREFTREYELRKMVGQNQNGQ